MSGSPCCQITPFQVALSRPTCALKSPERTRNSDEVAFPNATLTSSRKASYCDSMLGAYTCKIHRDRYCSLSFRRQTLLPSGTQSTTQRQAGSCEYQYLAIGLTRLGIKPKSTAPEADALTTRPSELSHSLKLIPILTTSLLDAQH